MQKLQLFLVDAEQDSLQRLRAAFRLHREMEIAGSATNGSEALRQILATPVDVLILDAQLPGMDGFMLLNDLRRMNRCPTSIICTRFYSEDCVELANRCGATYVLYKPLDYERLAEIVMFCHTMRRRRETSPKSSNGERARNIRRRLAALGFPASLSGSLYLTEAMLKLGENPSLLRNLSKGLYAAIAEASDATPSRVERALRSAIAIACERDNMRRFFDHRPTNREFFEFLLAEGDLKER